MNDRKAQITFRFKNGQQVTLPVPSLRNFAENGSSFLDQIKSMALEHEPFTVQNPGEDPITFKGEDLESVSIDLQ